MAVPARAGLRFAGAIKEELRDPLTPVLAVGAVASAIVGSGFDTMLVAAVMGGNALISGVQRIRAERALRRLFSEQEIVARRLRRSRRDGTAAETVAGLEAVPLETVPASALSPADVIALRASDVVPADARLLSAADLEVDESTLTGESIPVTKGVERVDVVCLDKTGTLTQGRLAVTGVTSFETDLERDHPRARRLLVTAARACPRVDPARIHSVPHATDRAVLEAATGQGDHHENWRLRTELPFETNRGYAAALGEAGDDTGTEPLTDERRRTAQHTVQHLAADGLRVLAVAERQREQPGDDVADGDVADLTLLGFVGVADTPRMVGMPADSVLTGADLDRMPEEERNRRVAQTSVFARVSPEQKVRIVEALQAVGHVVAMTGDGTNDAAAIRLADVGIGVAASESSAARSAADLVLADADVRRIHEALLEGRALWHQVRDAVSILVGGNAGEVAFMILGTALAGRAPITVRQMLLVNMLTDMFPALAVAVAPSRGDAQGPPSAALGPALARAVAIRGAATTVGATLAWTIA